MEAKFMASCTNIAVCYEKYEKCWNVAGHHDTTLEYLKTPNIQFCEVGGIRFFYRFVGEANYKGNKVI